MGSTFGTFYGAAAATWYAIHGQTAAYAAPGDPAGGVSTDCTVILHEDDPAMIRTDNDAEALGRRSAALYVRVADLTPALYGTFTIGTDVWTVTDTPEPIHGSAWRCRVATVTDVRINPMRRSG